MIPKFRVWEPETEIGKPGNMSYNQEFCFSQILHPDGCIIEQFTGLLDKNDDEIAQGDICRCQIYKTGEEVVLEVVWDKHMAGFYFENSDCWFNNDELSDIEIIGNIHENKDLL